MGVLWVDVSTSSRRQCNTVICSPNGRPLLWGTVVARYDDMMIWKPNEQCQTLAPNSISRCVFTGVWVVMFNLLGSQHRVISRFRARCWYELEWWCWIQGATPAVCLIPNNAQHINFVPQRFLHPVRKTDVAWNDGCDSMVLWWTLSNTKSESHF